ncbi:hypothetical protein HJC23_013329 [Cyclotella cryptica]|uniref:S-adenosylmethionine-dependent methyltransferase domain-containing protein n=1 Tax=Cyclotella cryptica TaxID=29204 RepID=A0ABD3Q0D6_9STRA|eukprot:CCRYP_009744-RA/>CCRYP_009744-RA protein AED:0.09 eAED:0.08 QI:0/-1/0/1/-1/1/1/0/438
MGVTTIAAKSILAISGVVLGSHCVNGFRQHHVRSSCPTQRSGSSFFQLGKTSGCPSTSSCAVDVSEEKLGPQRQPLGHPALLQAISDFPETILFVNITNTGALSTNKDARRIFHGRGGLYPGANHLTLDYYPPVFLLTSFEKLAEEELIVYGNALASMWQSLEDLSAFSADKNNGVTLPQSNLNESPFTWVYQCREKENFDTRLMAGEIPEPHIVTENNGGNKFLVHLLKGQNHGLFLDMSVGRKWLQNKCSKGENGIRSVLNLFAYTCAFSIAALNGGAETVVNVDMSGGALKIGQKNHELNDITSYGSKGTAKFLSHDIWKTWGKIKKLGPYDAVVVDPPSYQKGSFIATKDYIKVIRRLPSLLHPHGYALLCLNAPELGTEFLLEQVRIGVPNDQLKFVQRLDNPTTFASAHSERALKVLIFQYIPLANNTEEIH